MSQNASEEHQRPAGSAMVVAGSTFGTLFEWYDFFLYGALATQIAAHFFSGLNETTGFIVALIGFAIGFLFRPIGAILFGGIGDRFGRKNTFLATLAIMGAATVLIGCIPNYASMGVAAPIVLIALRILQGLAIGGEFGGAVTYVAEHAPPNRRGLHTSFLPASALAGLLLSQLVIAGVRLTVGAEAFEAWGWRIPFLLSAILLLISLWIRAHLHESPVFRRLQAEAAISQAPLADTLLRWPHLKLVLIAIAAVAGQAVVFYTGTFYALYFLQKAAKLDSLETALLLAPPLLIGFVLFLCAGWLSDKLGRKPVLLAGLALAALLTFPLFNTLLGAANPALARAQATAPITVQANPDTCTFQFDPVGRQHFDRTPCDIALTFLAGASASYSIQPAPGHAARITLGDAIIDAPDVAALSASDKAAAIAAFRERASAALARHGHTASADFAAMNAPMAMAALILLLFLGALCGGAVNAALAELFPPQIRYSALGLPQNIGNGWFGGFLPATAFAIVAATGNIYAGLWYPVIGAAVSFVICLAFLPETRGRTTD